MTRPNPGRRAARGVSIALGTDARSTWRYASVGVAMLVLAAVTVGPTDLRLILGLSLLLVTVGLVHLRNAVAEPGSEFPQRMRSRR